MAHVREWPAVLRARDDLLKRWQLVPSQVLAWTRYSLVTAVTRADGSAAVLKLARDGLEPRGEIAALRIWNGHAAARLLASDPEGGGMLLERVEPGRMLAQRATDDDAAATLVAACLLRQLGCAPPTDDGLQSLDRWLGAFDRLRPVIGRGQSGLPVDLFRRADRLRADLLASTTKPVVLHGDLHHFNILSATRAPWLAIDPKGLLGDRAFDVCQLLLNPIAVPVAVNQRRLAILCAELELDPTRARAWCFVHAVLNALWKLEEGRPLQHRLAWIEHVLAL